MAEQLILCHDCDLPNRVGVVPAGGSARCPRCRATLVRRVRDSLDRTLAFAVAGLLLLLVANAFPFLAMKMKGLVTETTLASGVLSLYAQQRPLVGSLVLLTTILAPLLHLSALLYVLLPLKLGVRAPFAALCFRWLHKIQAWSMMEVFMLGVLVSLVKLAGMAQIVPGIALWAFVALIPVMAAASELARRPAGLGPDRADRVTATARGRLACCHDCNLTVRHADRAVTTRAFALSSLRVGRSTSARPTASPAAGRS